MAKPAGKTSGWEAFRDRAESYETTMIPAETHEAFEKLLKDLYDEFSPVGRTEELLVQRLASLHWERDRLHRDAQFKMEIRGGELRRQVRQTHSFARLKSLAPEFKKAKTREELEKLFSKVDDVTVQLGKAWCPENCDPPEGWGDFIADQITSLPEQIHGRDVFFKLMEEFPVIERLEQLEKIDAVIDRTLKRFMQLKTMKQMFRQLEPKVITLSQGKKTLAKK